MWRTDGFYSCHPNVLEFYQLTFLDNKWNNCNNHQLNNGLPMFTIGGLVNLLGSCNPSSGNHTGISTPQSASRVDRKITPVTVQQCSKGIYGIPELP